MENKSTVETTPLLEKSAEKPKVEKKRKPKPLAKKGTKRQVFNGSALKTAGGLTKVDLVKSKSGRIVSKKASEQARANWEKRGGIGPKKEVVAESLTQNS